MTETLVFVCSICGESSTGICVYCTKDACANHCCERCRRCSDCCECELRLDDPDNKYPEPGIQHRANDIPIAPPAADEQAPSPDAEAPEPAAEALPPHAEAPTEATSPGALTEAPPPVGEEMADLPRAHPPPLPPSE